jgi:hypothetical protein
LMVLFTVRCHYPIITYQRKWVKIEHALYFPFERAAGRKHPMKARPIGGFWPWERYIIAPCIFRRPEVIDGSEGQGMEIW